jgi:hypothetical protein
VAAWVEGTVVEIAHREGGDQTLVTLQTEEGAAGTAPAASGRITG